MPPMTRSRVRANNNNNNNNNNLGAVRSTALAQPAAAADAAPVAPRRGRRGTAQPAQTAPARTVALPAAAPVALTAGGRPVRAAAARANARIAANTVAAAATGGRATTKTRSSSSAAASRASSPLTGAVVRSDFFGRRTRRATEVTSDKLDELIHDARRSASASSTRDNDAAAAAAAAAVESVRASLWGCTLKNLRALVRDRGVTMTGHRRISASREALVDALLASLSHLVSSPLSFPLSSPPLSPPSSSSLTSSSHLLPTLSLPTLSSSSRSSASSPVTPTSPQSSPTSPPSLNSLQNRLCVQQQHEPQPQIQKPVDEQDHSSYQQALWPVSPCPDASTLPPTSTIFVPSTPTSPNRGQVNAATTPTAPVFASCEVPLTATGGTSNTRSPSSRPRPGRLYSRARRPAPYTPAPRRVVDQLYREAFVFVPSARSPPLVAEATSRAYRQKRMEGPARPVEDIRRWDMVADDTLDSEKRMFARKAVSLAIAKEIARLAEEQMCPPTDVVVDPPLRWDPHTVLQQSPPPSPSKLSASEEGAESDEADEVAQVPTSTGPIYMRPLRMNRHQAFLFIDLHNRWTAPGFMADYQKMARRRSAPMPSPGATSTPALPATPFAKATFVLPPNRVMVSAAAIAGGMEFVGAPKTSSLTNYARDGCGPTAGPSGTSSVASGTLSDAAFRSSETASGTAMDPFTVARTGFATDSGTSGTACGTASGPSSAAQIPSLWKGKDREVPQARPTYVPDYGDYIFDDDLDVEIAAFPTPENEEYDVEGNH